MSSEQNHIDELITRSLTGESTMEDEKNLSIWIALSEENNQHYQKLKRIFALSNSYYKQAKQIPDINLDQEWNHFLKQIGSNKTDNGRTLNVPAKSGYNWLRIAAALLLIAVSSFIINYLISDSTTIIETADATREVTLPDGSRVTLNKYTQLTYDAEFGSETRNVSLKGEAFFDVERDPLKPFIITINNASVEVLGTSFNVQAYDSRKLLEVVVQTGTVRLSIPTAKKTVTLQAGDRGVFSRLDRALTQYTNSDINFLSWKTRKVIFIETDLRSVIETINHIYQSNITIAAQVPDTCVVTVTFDQQSLDAILNVLKTTLNLTYKTEDGHMIIIDAGC